MLLEFECRLLYSSSSLSNPSAITPPSRTSEAGVASIALHNSPARSVKSPVLSMSAFSIGFSLCSPQIFTALSSETSESPRHLQSFGEIFPYEARDTMRSRSQIPLSASLTELKNSPLDIRYATASSRELISSIFLDGISIHFRKSLAPIAVEV